MLGGLYGDLPPPTDDEKPSGNSSSVWSSSTKMAPPTLRKPPAFAPTQAILRSQNKPKPVASQYKAPPPPSSTPVITPVNDSVVPSQIALVGVTSSVIEEYDPARPNDYEEYRREKSMIQRWFWAKFRVPVGFRVDPNPNREPWFSQHRNRSGFGVEPEPKIFGFFGSGRVGFSGPGKMPRPSGTFERKKVVLLKSATSKVVYDGISL